MFGLKIGNTIRTIHNDEICNLSITKFFIDKNNNGWASLGELTNLVGYNDGKCGEKEWLISLNGESCWMQSDWKLI